MKWILTLLVLLTFPLMNEAQTDFLKEQKKFARFRTAVSEKQQLLENKLSDHQISMNNLNLLLVAYKEEGLLEVYCKTKQETNYRKLFSYAICSRSGQPGPKRKQGDAQVPEGFYYIDRFNPNSNFYLSLGLNYPNLSDQRKSPHSDLGGDIFIHGSCVTIGCLPMTDNFIKEIYLLAVHAKNNGQTRIPVYVFPFKMTPENMVKYKKEYKALGPFWENLKTGYDEFFESKKELKVRVAPNGDYLY